MKTIGKCIYCKDPVYDFQDKVKVGEVLFHKGCVHVLAEENPV